MTMNPQEGEPLIQLELGLKEQREKEKEDDDTASTTSTGSSSSSTAEVENPRYYRVAEWLFLLMSVVVVITICLAPLLLAKEQNEEDEFVRWHNDDDSVRVVANSQGNPYTVGTYNQEALYSRYKNYKPQPSPKNLYQWKEASHDGPPPEPYDWQHGKGVAEDNVDILTVKQQVPNGKGEEKDGCHPPQPGAPTNKESTAKEKERAKRKRINEAYDEYAQNHKIVVSYEHLDESCRSLKLHLTIAVDPLDQRRCPNTVTSLIGNKDALQLFRCCQLKDFYMTRLSYSDWDACLEYQDDFGAALYKIEEYDGDQLDAWTKFMVDWQPQCPDQAIMRSMELYC